jgi:enolase
MTDTRIGEVAAWMSLNSQGRPTLGCRVTLRSGHIGNSLVPAGTSRGRDEAAELRDDEPSPFGGYGVGKAIRAVAGPLREAVLGLDALAQASVDDALITRDGSADRSALGANSILAISTAAAAAASRAVGLPLWRHLASLRADDEPISYVPRPMVSLLSGGLHAGGSHPIQDFLVIPMSAGTVYDALVTAALVRARLAGLLRERAQTESALAPSGAFVNVCATAQQALQMLNEAIVRAGFAPGVEVGIAVDLAASHLLGEHGYVLDPGSEAVPAEGVTDALAGWCADYGVVLLEDPLGEDDWAGWAGLTRRLGSRCLVLGDDLFVTSVDRLLMGIDSGSGNAILLKPNQRGTLSEVMTVSDVARRADFRMVLSQRSVETEDASIADLAVGCGADICKFGPSTHSERLAKYNRLLEIECIDQLQIRPWQSPFTVEHGRSLP